MCRSAPMTEAKLDGADLAGADFTNANLNGVDLSKAVNLDQATGFDRARHYQPPLGSRPAAPGKDQDCLNHPEHHRPPPDAKGSG
jgi:hypothetical protein